MANILSTQVLKVLDIPQKFYLANELYVGSSLLLDTETEELILAQYSQNPDVYAELFRIGGNCKSPESWRIAKLDLDAGNYTEENLIVTKNNIYPVFGGFLGAANTETGNVYIDAQTAIPVITDIELSAGLNNVAVIFEDIGNNPQYLDLAGTVANVWRLKITFSGTYVFVPGQINWIKFKIDGVPAIKKVTIVPVLT